MPNTYNGYADIRGIGDGCTVAVGGYASVFVDSLPVAHRATVTEHIGTNGSTCAIVHTNEHFEITISFRPVSSVSQDEADEMVYFLPKGSVVTLSGFKAVRYGTAVGDPPVQPQILNTDWILVGDSTITLNANDPAVFDLTIRNYLDKQAALKVQVPVTVPPG